MRKLLFTILTLVLLASACSSGGIDIEEAGGSGGTSGGTSSSGGSSDNGSSGTSGGETDGTDTGGIIRSISFLAGLTPFGECDAALQHIKDEAAAQVGPWGFGNGGFDGPLPMPAFEDSDFGGDDGAMAEGDGEMAFDVESSTRQSAGGTDTAALPQTDDLTSVATSGSSAGGEFTDTYTQELGVDEPDIVKTDGTRILAVSDQTLYYIDLTGDSARLRGSVFLSQGWAHEMFIQGNRAYVFSSGETFFEGPQGFGPFRADVAVPEPGMPVEPGFSPGGPIGGWGGSAAIIQEVDLSNPDNMTVLATLSVDGNYISGRAIGQTARVVLSSPPANNLEFVFPSGEGSEDKAAEINREIIQESTLEDWVPEYTLTTANGTETGLLIDCNRLHKPAEFSGFSIMSVLTLDLAGGITPGNAVGVLADGDTVYASTDNLYVGTNVWVNQETIDGQGNRNWDEEYSTSIHQFSLSNEGEATYVASGNVRGHMLNQFAMNEHNGDLQVVTTDGSPWSNESSESFVTVLRPEGEQLTQIGQVGDLGRGETVFSARLTGDLGYIVTFRQTDPFYVIDLSDPTNPTTAGELKIPGNSTFLHVIDSTRVLGLGQNATDEGFTTGFKAELFDVSDPTNPQSIALWTEQDSYSVAEGNHKAFQYLPERDLFVMPLESWNSDFYGAILLNASDLTEYGRITQEPAPETTQGFSSGCQELTSDMFSEDSEMFWILQEGGVIQLCNDADRGGIADGDCEILPMEEIGYLLNEFDANGEPVVPQNIADLGEFDRLEWCWAGGFGGSQFPIQRTFSVGDSIWSFSWNTLQANDLANLDQVNERLTLGGQ